MILVTGGTGFIGSALIRHLTQSGEQVRILLHPSPQSPKLPRGMAMDVAICSLNDERSLQAAMKGVKVVYHLASAERRSDTGDLAIVDVQGTQAIVDAARKARIQRLFYLSHIGADKNSLFPALKAKALGEDILKRSNLNHTIFRASVVFGQGDHFTTQVLRGLRRSPGFFPLPGSGEVTLQPLWIQDLITCMTLSVEDERTYRKMLTIGGGEYFTFKQIVQIIMTKTRTWRLLIPFSPAYLRTLNLWLGRQGRGFPYSTTWLDYLAADRTCALDTLPKLFGLLPARFEKELGYLNKF